MTDLSTLSHTVRPLSGGGKVLVLDTGAVIGPEAEAMLQALHSRSVGGISNHLQVLAEKGAEKFMSTFYVGYGHKSIGDCGSATIFIEGISLLAAKAIQDWPLYSGQESSTRYIDFSQQPFIDPVGTPASVEFLARWRALYLDGLSLMQEELTRRFPRAPEEKEGIYRKAIAARAFDTMRSFLPAGAATNIAWHGNLRQFADKLMVLRHHPLGEVQEIAAAVDAALAEQFPSSFCIERFQSTETFNHDFMQSNYYFNPSSWPVFEVTADHIDHTLLREYSTTLRSRPQKTELPKQIAECGTMEFRFLLDFGSFRDLQRHRAVTQRMPLLTTRFGFHPWYLGEFPRELRERALALLHSQEIALPSLGATPEIAQYYIPIGYQTANRLTGPLPALLYIAELRSTRFVHPTLRERARQMASTLQDRFAADGLVLHLDQDADRFDVRRGEHDIVRREAAAA